MTASVGPLRTFTIDTNCILDVDEHRKDAAHIRALADAHAAGTVNVAVVAIAASERQRGDEFLTTFGEFEARLTKLGLAHLDVLLPMGYWDIAFFDRAVWPGEDEIRLERSVHDTLFPHVPFDVADLSPGEQPLRRWRNAKCDVQAFWAHLSSERDVFVTNDRVFHKQTKKPRLIALANRDICILRPQEAAELLARNR